MHVQLEHWRWGVHKNAEGEQVFAWQIKELAGTVPCGELLGDIYGADKENLWANIINWCSSRSGCLARFYGGGNSGA